MKMEMQPKTITILGSTGSIGTQALDVVKKNGWRVHGLCANQSVDTLEAQIRAFSPRVCVVAKEEAARDLRDRVRDCATEIRAGETEIEALASEDAPDFVLNSMMGSAGLRPTLAAIEAGKNVALANKETLVTAGTYVMSRARAKGVSILPVDSEHSAIFQCLQGNCRSELSKILLTASGGPFFGYGKEQLQKVTKAQTLAHPTWNMGAKITVDSATMMNKGFEVIEAVHLFDVAPEQIEVVVHRESIIHSMVEYCDGVVMAQMGAPDMRTCIQYALTYPHRQARQSDRLDLTKVGTMHFYAPDYENFPLLSLAYDSIAKGDIYTAALNGANEQAVAYFLQEKISYYEISQLVKEVVAAQKAKENPTLQDLIDSDFSAREAVRNLCK
jgi:1-deoxy-D-xylulose-5-phosphate reductoisomerase